MSTPPMPMPLASHSSSKVLSKSGSCSSGACVSFDLRASKACCCTGPHRNGTPFFVNSWRGAEIPHETPVETCKTKKTTNLRDRSRKWPARDGNNLCLIHLNALRCNNITKKRHSIGAKGALLKVTEQTCLAQDIKNSTQMLKMYIIRLAVNVDIIKINHHEFTNE